MRFFLLPWWTIIIHTLSVCVWHPHFCDYPFLFQRINILEHTSRILISNVKKGILVFVVSLIRDVVLADWEEGSISRHGSLTNRFLIPWHSSPGFYKSVWHGVCLPMCVFVVSARGVKMSQADIIFSVSGKKWMNPLKIT